MIGAMMEQNALSNPMWLVNFDHYSNSTHGNGKLIEATIWGPSAGGRLSQNPTEMVWVSAGGRDR
jgi:hypothetical protein